jgi:Family of unknown function (DUF5343)
MSLTSAYLLTTKNLPAFFNAIQGAQAPERFTAKFLQDLEFKSSNDRLFIGLLKGLGFIDDSGNPQERYYQFLDQTEAPRILADAIEEAYDDLFRINKEAYKLTEDDIRNKLKTLTRGEKSEKVISLMAKTFSALCEYADWTKRKKLQPPAHEPASKQDGGGHADSQNTKTTRTQLELSGLHYNIQIHLPSTRDAAVYDAIFRSLRDHLM